MKENPELFPQQPGQQGEQPNGQQGGNTPPSDLLTKLSKTTGKKQSSI